MKKFYKTAAALFFAAMMTTTAQAQDETVKYVKVTTEQADWRGEYLIVYEYDDDNNIAYIFDGAREGDNLDKKNNFIELSNPEQEVNGESVRAIDSSAEADAATFTVTASANEGKYNIMSKSGYWIGYDSTEPDPETGEIEPDMETSNETPIANHIAMQDGKTSVVVTAGNGFELRFNADDGKTRFRYHASGKKKAIKFYKKTVIGDNPTGITNVESKAQNGQIFDLQGRTVSNTQAGRIYIKNGKKIIK